MVILAKLSAALTWCLYFDLIRLISDYILTFQIMLPVYTIYIKVQALSAAVYFSMYHFVCQCQERTLICAQYHSVSGSVFYQDISEIALTN